MSDSAANTVIIVMGVSGVGKSTIAEELDKQLRWPFQEGDALHPPSNVQKMHAGIPLTDEDRAPWLAAIKDWIDARVTANEPGLVTCSALKRRYRNFLIAGRSQVRVLYLKADEHVIEERIEHRTGHFMPPALLESQLHTLEEPVAEENPIVVDVEGSLEATVDAAMKAINAALAAYHNVSASAS